MMWVCSDQSFVIINFSFVNVHTGNLILVVHPAMTGKPPGMKKWNEERPMQQNPHTDLDI